MKPRADGYVLIFVLLVLLALTVAAAGYFSMTARGQRASQDLLAQEVAVGRAQMAAEQAVLDVRAGVVSLTDLTPRTEPDGVAGCGGNCITRGPIDNGSDAGVGLSEGGGLQWEYAIYKSDQIGTPLQRYTIQATGYYGFRQTSVTYATARVEVEMDVGSAASGPPTDPNGASGAM
jgi:hypothetical protein